MSGSRLGILHRLRITMLGGLFPQGTSGIKILGHRNYVGAKWDEIGRLQFAFMLEQGLKPEHCFLDIGCGALRGGVHFIPYLKPGNYLGLDRESELIDRGLRKEIPAQIAESQKPEFVVSTRFEFSRFSRKPKFSLALSLFTHLAPDDIRQCLRNLGEFVPDGHRFYATFFEGSSSKNPNRSHSLNHFEYDRGALADFADPSHWRSTYLGDWNHPRGQMMMMFEAGRR